MVSVTAQPITVGGPFFEELRVGEVMGSAPGLTLTAGHAALHQAVLGDRLHLPLDAPLAARVTGTREPLAHPALVWDVAIGQSTLVTQRVIANLFYRGLALRRMPAIGDTLYTSTEVVGLRQNRLQPGRDATGMAVLRVRTLDQEERPVLDFLRCAMLPLRDPTRRTGHSDDLAELTAELDADALCAPPTWELDEFRSAVPGPHFADLVQGTTWSVAGGDVVSAAPELARLSLNVAMAHHDDGQRATRQRLVYGGHTIGIAASHVTRAIPSLVTIVGWHSCDHLAPVLEGDTLRSTIELERCQPLPDGGGLIHLRARVQADRAAGTDVLDWRLVGLMA